MAKKEKAAEGNFDEAKAAHEAAIKTRKAARKAVEDFEKEKGLAPMKKHGDNKEHGKAWTKLRKTWSEAKEAEAEAEKAVKALKPKTERSSGKYEYPADCVTGEDKKKYRAAQRAAAKKAAKGEGKEEKSDKKAKKAKKEEAPAAEEVKAEKSSKKDKKKKKAKKED